MPECIDVEARDRIAKLYTEVRQHSMDYWGPDKTNGKRSEIDDLTGRVDAIETSLTHHLDTRESTCVGLEALREYRKSLDEEEVDVRVAKINRGGGLAMQWVQLLAIVVVALIGLFK